MRNLVRLGAALFLIIFISGCFKEGETTIYGTLNGKVSLSPLCVDEPCDLNPKELEAVYGARKIIIYSADTSEVIQTIGLAITGDYGTNLPEGDYILDINYYENDISPDVPVKVSLVQGFTLGVDIIIYTGL